MQVELPRGLVDYHGDLVVPEGFLAELTQFYVISKLRKSWFWNFYLSAIGGAVVIWRTFLSLQSIQNGYRPDTTLLCIPEWFSVLSILLRPVIEVAFFFFAPSFNFHFAGSSCFLFVAIVSLLFSQKPNCSIIIIMKILFLQLIPFPGFT